MAELKKINVNDSDQSPPSSQEAEKPEKAAQTVAQEKETDGKGFKAFVTSLPWPKILLVILAIVAGVGTGYGAHYFISGSSGPRTVKTTTDGKLKSGDAFGVEDPGEIFPDTATGVLVKGGVDGEGSHHLMRPPDESQNVYLTSTVLDLDQFIGHKIKVWGQTNDASKAGWLMDVGKVKIEELNAQKPY